MAPEGDCHDGEAEAKPMTWHRHFLGNFFHRVPTELARAEIERIEGEDGMVPPYLREKVLDHMYGKNIKAEHS